MNKRNRPKPSRFKLGWNRFDGVVILPRGEE